MERKWGGIGGNCKVWDDLEALNYGQLCKPGLKEKDTNALYYNLQVLNRPHLLKASFSLPYHFPSSLSFVIFFLFATLSLSPQNYYLSKVIEVFIMQLIGTFMQICGRIGFFCCIFLVLRPYIYIYACPIWLSPVVNLFLWCLSTPLRITIVSCNLLSTLHKHIIKLIKGDKKVVQTQDTPNTSHSISNTRHNIAYKVIVVVILQHLQQYKTYI